MSNDNLVSTALIFLPPKKVSKLQLMSQGVLRSLKGYSMGLSGWKLIEAIEKNKPLAEFSILHAIQILDIAW